MKGPITCQMTLSLFTGTQKPQSWPHLGLFQRCHWPRTSDFLCPLRPGLWGHANRLLQGPSSLRLRSGAISVRILKCWNTLRGSLIMSPSISDLNNIENLVPHLVILKELGLHALCSYLHLMDVSRRNCN